MSGNNDFLKIEGKKFISEIKHLIDLHNKQIKIYGMWDINDRWVFDYINKIFCISSDATGELPRKYRITYFIIDSPLNDMVSYKITFTEV